MARTMFAATVVLKLMVWAVMWFGIYVAVRAFIDGEIALGLLIIFIGIPVALWGTRLVLGVGQMIVLFPIALVAGRKREYLEFSSFQLAVVDAMGTDRLKLRQGRLLLGMFKELPPPSPGEPARSGRELLHLYEEIHVDDDDEVPAEPPCPALS